ncbi:flagellar motor protein MotB [Sphingobium boeckii]|uniref:Chemotaxis protein MotB n=1 Tax=Sphingobium boeckii TaxID=1082345 RepID=A0A7W9AGK7_9SPHN|nr:flagellar motor protein MotB [Sphingobium boeckii]MBB5685230.1 chemotaxis protein MotB [Sphingobium boeckii]
MVQFSQDDQPIIVIRKVNRKKPAAHHGGAWKVAYADFVTAMMAFFMLLWLLATPDKGRLKGLAEYFSPATSEGAPAVPTLTNMPGDEAGFGGHRRRAQADAVEAKGETTAEAGTKGAARGGTADIPEAAMRMLADEMMVALEASPATPVDQRQVRVDQQRNGVRINLMDTANRTMFRGPTAELNGYARELLGKVARRLIKSGAQIAIEGHTDSSGGQSDANWRLSSERALAARSAMVAAGLTVDHFSEVVAKAGTAPIYPDRPDRPENRRITIVILGDPSVLPRDVSFKF